MPFFIVVVRRALILLSKNYLANRNQIWYVASVGYENKKL